MVNWKVILKAGFDDAVRIIAHELQTSLGWMGLLFLNLDIVDGF